MICKHCNFENKDGAAFCANCGKPLEAPTNASAMQPMDASAMKPMGAKDDTKTVLLDPMSVANENTPAPIDDEDGEANTTVLTANMTGKLASGAAPAPQGFGSAPKQAPQGFGSAPTPANGPKPMNGAPTPMGAPMPMNGPANGPKPANGAPMGAPAQMQMNAPTNAPTNASKQAPAKPAKAKSSAGTKVYIIVSAIVMVALVGVGVWGYLSMNSKIKDANKEKDNVASELDAANVELDSLNLQIDGLEANAETQSQTIMDLNDTIDSYETQIADYEAQVSDLSASSSANAGIVGFAANNNGKGYEDFFVSDTIIHLTGETTLRIFFDAPEEYTILYMCSDENVCTCSDGGFSANGYVGNLILTPVSSGSAIITIGNEANDETIEIYVYVD